MAASVTPNLDVSFHCYQGNVNYLKWHKSVTDLTKDNKFSKLSVKILCSGQERCITYNVENKTQVSDFHGVKSINEPNWTLTPSDSSSRTFLEKNGQFKFTELLAEALNGKKIFNFFNELIWGNNEDAIKMITDGQNLNIVASEKTFPTSKMLSKDHRDHRQLVTVETVRGETAWGPTVNVYNEAWTDNFQLSRFTPLHFVCHTGQVDIAKVLIAKGSDIELADKNGRTPLINAVRCFQLDIVKTLINAGCKLDTLDDSTLDAIEQALRLGHISIFEVLFENKMKNIKNDDKKNAIKKVLFTMNFNLRMPMNCTSRYLSNHLSQYSVWTLRIILQYITDTQYEEELRSTVKKAIGDVISCKEHSDIFLNKILAHIDKNNFEKLFLQADFTGIETKSSYGIQFNHSIRKLKAYISDLTHKFLEHKHSHVSYNSVESGEVDDSFCFVSEVDIKGLRLNL